MQENKDQIVSGILKARTELDEVLYELEKLPAISESSVYFAAHALNNYLTVTGGTVRFAPVNAGGKSGRPSSKGA